MTDCCTADWRVEALDLATGARRQFLQPISIEFKQELNSPGDGTIVLPVRSVTMADVWPHATSIALLRINGPGATPTAPVCEYIGIVEEVSATSDGSISVGMKSIEYYLAYRLTGGVTYTNDPQTEIGADLVNRASTDGIPLNGTFDASAIDRDRTYKNRESPVILEKVQQLTQVNSGPDYELIHSFSGGSWSTEMRFRDFVGDQTAKPLNVRRGVTKYGIQVNASNHATRVRATGNKPNISHTANASYPGGGTGPYPRFVSARQWSSVSRQSTIQSHAEGSVEQDKHPVAVPSVTIADLDISGQLDLGGVIDLSMDHGAIQYDGQARLTGKSWAVANEQPTMCTLTMVPIDDAVTAILGSQPTEPCKDC